VDAAREMAKHGDQQASVVQFSIGNQYQGLIAPKSGQNGSRPTRYEQVMSKLDQWDPNDTRTDEAPLALTRSNVGQ
jgi:hypothetical protein